MIFGANDAHIHFLLFIQFVEQNFRGSAGSDDYGFVFQVGKIFDIATLFGQQARTDHENSVRESRLFLAFDVVGGRTTFKIESAVLQQWNTVL